MREIEYQVRKTLESLGDAYTLGEDAGLRFAGELETHVQEPLRSLAEQLEASVEDDQGNRTADEETYAKAKDLVRQLREIADDEPDTELVSSAAADCATEMTDKAGEVLRKVWELVGKPDIRADALKMPSAN
jgi:hypothetical protein